jgi:hypothetical protein
LLAFLCFAFAPGEVVLTSLLPRAGVLTLGMNLPGSAFLSLKKTCRKLGISFWRYLQDRTSGKREIPPPSDFIGQAAQPLDPPSPTPSLRLPVCSIG